MYKEIKEEACQWRVNNVKRNIAKSRHLKLKNLIEGNIKVLTEDKVETKEKRETGDSRDAETKGKRYS